MSPYKFSSYSRPIGTKENFEIFAWCVFLDGTRKQIDEIKQIEYTLHPSFPDPVRVVQDPTHCFVLQSQGWGVFEIRARIMLKNGTLVRATFPLKFRENPWPLGPTATEFESTAAEKIYSALVNEGRDWRKLSTLSNRAAVSLIEVTRLLELMALKRLARKSYYLSLENEEMWGATCKVGILPEPNS
jgi:transcription initiation factor IIF auxiliary subunit